MQTMFLACTFSLRHSSLLHFHSTLLHYSGQDGSVGVATRYELDGPGIESRWGEIFRTSPDWIWHPPNLL